MMLGFSSITASLLWLTLGLGPQDPADPQKPAGDPQASFEPSSTPGSGQEFLALMVGDYDVEKAFYLGPVPIRSQGTCRQELIHGGRFLKSEFDFEGLGATTGTGLIGYEPSSDRFTSVWVDSRATRMSMRRSSTPFDGQRIVLESASLDPASPSREGRTTRTITEVEDQGARIVHRQYILADGKTDRLMMELMMTRRPKAD